MASSNPVVSSLNDYIEQNKSELILKTMFEAESAKYLNLMTDVKGQTSLNLLDVSPVIQDGSACGWNESGTTTASQRVIDAKPLKVNMGFCDKKLLGTYAQHQVKVAAGVKTNPFEEQFFDGIKAGIGESIEQMIWQGASGSTTNFEGYLSILADTNEDDIISASGATGYNKIKKAYLAAPAKITKKDDAVIFVGTDLYKDYIADLVAANLYHYNPEMGANEYILPGTRVKVVGVEGLSTTEGGVEINGVTWDKPVIVGRTSNFVYGISGNGDDETLDSWYSQDEREFRVAVEWVAGVQVAYPNEISIVNG